MPLSTRQPISTSKRVRQLKDAEQDFEWYPTTAEMIEAIKTDMSEDKLGGSPSVMDCGAGDGRLLRALTEGAKYAIEKSTTLLSAIKHDVYIVGTDFNQQTLLDKKADVIVSNPPYSEYEAWADKIIREGNAKENIYLIIPKRWESSKVVQAALSARNVETKVIYEGDFLDADRQARAKINIVKLIINPDRNYTYRDYIEMRRNPKAKRPKFPKEPFTLWFDTHFKINANKCSYSINELNRSKKEALKSEADKHELIQQKGIIEMLVEFYNADLTKLMETYKSIETLDSNLLSELDVNLDGLKNALKQRVFGLKDAYWRELFDRLTSVTDRLTSSKRQVILNKLFSQTIIDFSSENAHALALWVVKNANQYLDAQLIDIVEKMISSANIVNYVSNQRTFDEELWRYNRGPENPSHFKLDMRIVLSNIGGIYCGSGSDVNGLTNNAATFLNDLSILAGNIGFMTAGTPVAAEMQWETGKKNLFLFRDTSSGDLHTLFEAKAFLNGNLHIKFNQRFICALNCEFGRLKGWLKTREEAAKDLDIDLDLASGFGANIQLSPTDLTPRLGFDRAA